MPAVRGSGGVFPRVATRGARQGPLSLKKAEAGRSIAPHEPNHHHCPEPKHTQYPTRPWPPPGCRGRREPLAKTTPSIASLRPAVRRTTPSITSLCAQSAEQRSALHPAVRRRFHPFSVCLALKKFFAFGHEKPCIVQIIHSQNRLTRVYSFSVRICIKFGRFFNESLTYKVLHGRISGRRMIRHVIFG